MIPGATLFDAYVVVDWSASATPKAGRDSIWIGEGVQTGQRVDIGTPRNPRTRAAACEDIRGTLRGHVAARRRVLLSFDVVYGYPRGFADALGLPGPGRPWLRTWRYLADAIHDDDRNGNNRWTVAAEVNRRLGTVPGPFWNCPRSVARPELCATKGAFPHVARDGQCLAEYRIADVTMRRTKPALQSVWKLYTTGSVGSQTLLGIPRLHALRTDPELERWSLIWPFETGFAPDTFPASGPFVLHAEAWPGIVPDLGRPGFTRVKGRRCSRRRAGDEEARVSSTMVRDASQVMALVRHFAGLDTAGKLAALFEQPAHLTDDELAICCDEEGWILGAEAPRGFVSRPVGGPRLLGSPGL